MRREYSYVQSHVGIPPGAERAFQLHILELRKQAWGIRRSTGSTVKRTGGDALRAPGLGAGGAFPAPGISVSSGSLLPRSRFSPATAKISSFSWGFHDRAAVSIMDGKCKGTPEVRPLLSTWTAVTAGPPCDTGDVNGRRVTVAFRERISLCLGVIPPPPGLTHLRGPILSAGRDYDVRRARAKRTPGFGDAFVPRQAWLRGDEPVRSHWF